MAIVSKVKPKTPSQRLRGVLYRLWEKDESDISFDQFYEDKMEVLIEYLKEKVK